MILLITDTLAFQFLVTTTLVLIVITLYLFAASIIVRNAHARDDYYQEKRKEIYYPLILDYIIEESDDLGKVEHLVKREEDMEPLLQILYEIMDSVEGSEVERLRDILQINRIRRYHYKNLTARNHVDRMNACAYFSRLGRLNDDEYARLEKLLSDNKLMMAHTAATALMSSEDVLQRGNALTAIMQRRRVSRLAILDLLYLFHNSENDQMDEEAAYLIELIANRELPNDNIAIIVKGMCEIGYVGVAIDLFSMLETGYWDHSELVTESLIFACGRFSLGFTAPLLVEKYGRDSRPSIRRAVLSTLDSFDDSDHVEFFFEMARDPEFAVRLKAIYALASLGDTGLTYLQKLSDETKELRSLIRHVTEEVAGGTHG